MDILKDLYLFQLIQSPTHLASVLDLILTNNSDSSDHYPIVLNIWVSCLFKTPAKSLRYKFDYENFEAISQALYQLPLSSGLVNIASQEDFDAAWEL